MAKGPEKKKESKLARANIANQADMGIIRTEPKNIKTLKTPSHASLSTSQINEL